MIIGSEIKGDYKISVDVQALQNPRNLKRAYIHMRAVVHGESEEAVKRHPRCYHIYTKDVKVWDHIRLMTCAHYGVLHVADIPYGKVEEANDYAISLIDQMVACK